MRTTPPAHPTFRSRRGIVASATTIVLGLSAVGISAVGLTVVGVPAAFAAPATQTIAAVQGSADGVSPLLGTTQTVEGIVTADYRGASGYRGIVVQTAGSGGAQDATPNASDGIFVYLAGDNPAVALGDRVTATGNVAESFGLTQIGGGSVAGVNQPAATVELVTAKAQLAATDAPLASPLADTVVGSARESLESMLVSPTGTYKVGSSFQLYNFGTLWLTAGPAPIVKSTETTDASDPAAAQIAAANRANRILLDDGYSIQTSNKDHPGDQPYFRADAVARTGDTVDFPASPYVLSYGFDDWRLQPIVPINDASPAEFTPTFTSTNPRPATPPAVGGDFSVAAFNVFNYFTTLTSENSNARGAASAEKFALQRRKIVAAINGLDADIVALMEIENNVKLGEPADTALANLVAGLNDAAGGDVWAFVPTPAALATPEAAATTDYITSAIIYKKAVATRVGDSFADIDETVWDNAREPIAQTFEVDGKVLTVVANHFKSKSPPSGGGTEPADGQGFFNADRVDEANSVLQFVNTITSDPAKSENVVLLGDFNSYAQEDPIQVLTRAGMVDLLPTKTDDQYTYEFNGELGSLDHAIATPSLAASVTGTGAWNINSPEWSDRGYAFGAAEPNTPYRSSDHDPIKLGISAAQGPVSVDIISINDFHGRIEASAPAAGAAVLGGMVNSYRAANPNTLFVSAGDNIGASTFTSFIQQDQPTIDALNSIGLDASALGNHEFDRGAADLDERILPSADWSYLAANVYDRGTEDAAYDEYWLSEVDGVTVGFIGAITEEVPSLVSPSGIADLTFGPVVPAVNRVADQLSDGNAANGEADVLVLLVHEGAATADIAASTNDSAFGKIVAGVDANVDAIVSGHTHQAYDHKIAVAGTTKVRPVLQSGQYGERFGHLNLSVDPATGELLSITSEVLPLFGAYEPDAEVAQIVADAAALATVKGSVQLGSITDDFNRALQADGTTENRGGESTLGNFVADVQLWATQDASSEIALMNPGGLRTDLRYAVNPLTPGDAEGVVTYQKAAGVQPFANTLVAMDLTSEQLRAVLEEQWQPATASRPFLKLGLSKSIEYTYDPAAAAGEHIDAIYVNGELVQPGDSYRVTVNSFLASGGDNFTTLASGTNRADTGKVDLQSMVDYLTQFPTASPDYTQRSVGVTLSPADADGYSSGDSVTLDLSSLLFSNGEPNAGTATVSLGDTVLGSVAIDPAIVSTTDEVGRASVSFTVPDGLSGAQALTVTVPETGTSIDVPIVFAETDLQVMINIDEPFVSGQSRVGSTLVATCGVWNSPAPTCTFQWNRDGMPIPGATSAMYRIVAADAGAELSVSVVANSPGYEEGTATSSSTTVQKISSTTYSSVSRTFVFRGQTVSYTALVKASGVLPTGDVTIYDGRRPVAIATLDDNGRATVSLPKLSRGIHLLTARYEGTGQLVGSTASPRLVIIF